MNFSSWHIKGGCHSVTVLLCVGVNTSRHGEFAIPSGRRILFLTLETSSSHCFSCCPRTPTY